MGLTKDQWQAKRISELKEYIQKHGHKWPIGENVFYWDTYPIVIKDICTTGVGVFTDKVVFCDYSKDKPYLIHRRNAEDVERKYLEEVLADMKQLDKNKQ